MAIAPPLNFISKNSSSGYLVEERQIKNRNIKKYLGGVQTKKKKLTKLLRSHNSNPS